MLKEWSARQGQERGTSTGQHNPHRIYTGLGENQHLEMDESHNINQVTIKMGFTPWGSRLQDQDRRSQWDTGARNLEMLSSALSAPLQRSLGSAQLGKGRLSLLPAWMELGMANGLSLLVIWQMYFPGEEVNKRESLRCKSSLRRKQMNRGEMTNTEPFLQGRENRAGGPREAGREFGFCPAVQCRPHQHLPHTGYLSQKNHSRAGIGQLLQKP